MLKLSKCLQNNIFANSFHYNTVFNIRRFGTQTVLLEIRKLYKQPNSKRDLPKMIDKFVKVLLQELSKRPLYQPVYIQSVEEVVTSLKPFLCQKPEYLEIIPLMCVPDQMHIFQVPWVDDNSVQRVNTGYRVQFNQALGPYKGGLRFHPSVDLSVVKFLGFEQIFKNALTGLPIGGGKGGSDFDPKGKSIKEIHRFCQSFMNKLAQYIGPDKDVPAGDIGVGAREIGYLYGQYKRLTNTFHGSLTGKGIGWGGSYLRPEATGYGLVYITECHFNQRNDSLKNKKCLVSGSGNVAQFAAKKLIKMGAKVLTLSDSNGTIYNKNGFTKEQLKSLIKLKSERKRCKELIEQFNEVQYFENKKPWQLKIEAQVAFPCATQNEIDSKDAKDILKSGATGVFEGANMPCTNEAIKIIMDSGASYIPGKAANAGGVAVSCLEMAQNSARSVWKKEKVDFMLRETMENIYKDSDKCAKELGFEGDYRMGANVVGFKRVADAMFQQGLVFSPNV